MGILIFKKLFKSQQYCGPIKLKFTNKNIVVFLAPQVPIYVPLHLDNITELYCTGIVMASLWIVFILVILSLNLVVSCPHVLYYLYLHTFMLFRSTCSGIFL